ncbi:hypothetical protein ACOMHN_032908 [Nucella lapillus]
MISETVTLQVADDETTVNSLLLKEIDFLTLPTVTAPDSPHTRTPATPDTQPLLPLGSPATAGQPAANCPPLHPLPWPWGWEDSLPTSSLVTTLPFCADSPTENFDLLAYTENSVDSLIYHTDATSRTDQFKEFDERSPHEHHLHQQYEFSADLEQSKHQEQPSKQNLAQQLSDFVDGLRKSERSDDDLPRRKGSGDNYGSLCTAKTTRENQDHEPGTRFNRVPESERFGDLEENCKQLQESKKATNQTTRSLDAALEEETRFTLIKKQRVVANGEMNEPKRPQNGFIRYSVQHRAKMSRQHPYKDNRGISKLLGTRWKKMTQDEKRPYEEEFNKDIHKIRTQHPMWRYAPVKKSAQDLAEPMANRLRPRDKIRSRYQDLDDAEWDWELPKNTAGDFSRQCADSSKSPLQHGATSWIQCVLCSLWRPLPGHVDTEDLPETWSCFMNPDKRFSVCGQVFSSLPVNNLPTTTHLPSFLQQPKPAQPPTTSRSNNSVVSSPYVSSPPSQPSLFIVYSSLPSMCAPANSIAHAILVSQPAAVAL